MTNIATNEICSENYNPKYISNYFKGTLIAMNIFAIVNMLIIGVDVIKERWQNYQYVVFVLDWVSQSWLPGIIGDTASLTTLFLGFYMRYTDAGKFAVQACDDVYPPAEGEPCDPPYGGDF